MNNINNIKVRLSVPCIGSEELEAIKDVMDSGCCAGTCSSVHAFEEEFASFVGSKYAVATSSCTTALHVACLALDVDHRSRAAIPAYTFPATGFAPLYCHSSLQVVDVDPETWNIEPEEIDYHACDVIMPVHCFGNPADMMAIMDCAQDAGASVIEDAACALPAYHGAMHAGTIGDVGCYSFYAIKNLCTGEGGMLVTDNECIARKARSLVDFGKVSVKGKSIPEFKYLGFNYRLSGLQAAMGRAQLKKLPEMHSKRKHIASVYNDLIADQLADKVTTQQVLSGHSHAYQRFAVVLENNLISYFVIQDMLQRGIQTTIGTYDLSSMPIFSSYTDTLRVSNKLFNQSLALPMHPGMTEQDVHTVVDALAAVLKG